MGPDIFFKLSILSKDALCQVWITWSSGSDENVKRLWTDRQTDGLQTIGDQKIQLTRVTT